MRNKIVVLLALVAVAGFAAAGALTVKQRTESASLHAERFTVGETFLFDASAIAPVLASDGAAGVAGSPVEMSSAIPMARTALTRDHWQYAVRLKELNVATVPSGQFQVELQVDGVLLASPAIVIAQTTNEPSAQEGVLAIFDLGPSIQPSSLYYVVVKPVATPGQTVSYTLRSGLETSTNRWIGVGEPINNVFNPTLTLAVGKSLALTAIRGTGEGSTPHNIGVFASGATDPASPPGWSEQIKTDGAQTSIVWTPTSAGTYTYACQYHATMTGTITVTA